jgi:hypothetical protein
MCWVQGAVGSKVELRVLHAQLFRKLPKVADHLEVNLECSASAVASSWFATLFTSLLPPEVRPLIIDLRSLGSK